VRRFVCVAAAISLALVFAPSSALQMPAAQTTPEALTAQYKQAMGAQDWPHAIAAARQLVDHSPTAENLWLLADVQMRGGAMNDALATCDRALAAADKEKPAEGQPDTVWKDGKSRIYLTQGNAYLKLHRNRDAIDAYNRAADLAANPSIAYFSLCATLYNTGDTQNSPAACRKSLQADPSRADAWFLLGSALFVSAPMDAKGSVDVTAEARQALEKYLELAPDGPHAADVKAMLQMAK
jgi:tetratricopeptide (TPR) repeat protein